MYARPRGLPPLRRRVGLGLTGDEVPVEIFEGQGTSGGGSTATSSTSSGGDTAVPVYVPPPILVPAPPPPTSSPPPPTDQGAPTVESSTIFGGSNVRVQPDGGIVFEPSREPPPVMQSGGPIPTLDPDPVAPASKIPGALLALLAMVFAR